MGLLDSVLGQVLGGNAQGAPGGTGGLGGLAGALGGLLASNQNEVGGLGGLVSKFEQAGLGNVVNSWIGKGDNVPVTGDQVHNALGSDVISSIAGKLGINAATLLPLLASLLPMLIDQLTPHGRLPEPGEQPGGESAGTQNDLLASLSGLLQKR